MTYSSAWFPADSEDLYTAQLRKIDSVLDLVDVRTGTHVLEIGTVQVLLRDYREARRSRTWIHQYVFPGGQLAYCEAGFRAGYLDVWQFAMARQA